MINFVRNLFFSVLILFGSSLVSFGQKSDDKKTPKPTPPKIVIPPDKPNNGKKPNGYPVRDVRIKGAED